MSFCVAKIRPPSKVLRLAASQGNPRERAVALHVLGKQGCVDFVDDAKQFLVAQMRQSDRAEQAFLRTSYVRYLQAIDPELTLPLARDWLFAPWPQGLATRSEFLQLVPLTRRSWQRARLTR